MDPSQILNRLNALAAPFSRAQRITLGVTFLTVAALVAGGAYFLQVSSYRLLFSNLDAEAAAEVVARLQEQDVPYQIADGGSAIRVPGGRIDELRLDFAGRGLPASGRIGFEIFDRTTFGATDFLEQVNYRRALEGEIARTITSLAEVAEARVHIALAKDSLFVTDKQAAKASVVLKLRQQRQLAGGTARAIATLVAASVEGLDPDSVVIVDSSGRSLATPSRQNEQDTALVEEDQRLERDLTNRLVALLEPVVGSGGVRVTVSADLSRDSAEETEERWDPNPVIRSRQVSGSTETFVAVGGVSGARSNTPGVTPDAGPASAPMAGGRGSETTNYEIGKTVRRSVRPGGSVTRLSVAVVIDDERVASTDQDGQIHYKAKRRDAGELRKIQNLVSAAVGYNPNRGDQLTVENISFEQVPEFAPAPASMMPIPLPLPVSWQPYIPTWNGAGRWAVTIVLGVLGFFIVRVMLRRAIPLAAKVRAAVALPMALPSSPAASVAGVAAAVDTDLPRTVQELQAELDARLDTVSPERTFRVRGSTEVSRRVAAIAKSDPEDTARLMRSWLVEDSR